MKTRHTQASMVAMIMVDFLQTTKKATVMKRVLLLIVSIVLLSMASCQKDQHLHDGQFKASIETMRTKYGKVTFDMTDGFVWQSDDQIMVCRRQTSSSNRVYMGTYTIDESSINTQTGYASFTFNNNSGETNVATSGYGSFFAYYPSSIRGSTNTMTSNDKIIIPTKQIATNEGKMHGMPMYAETSGFNLPFKNLCGILRLHLSGNSGDRISIIKITTDAEHSVAGTFAKQLDDEGYPYIETAHLASNAVGISTVTILYPTPQDIGNGGKDFCIYLPVGDYPHMEIRIWTDNDRYCKKVFNGGSNGAPNAVNIARSCYTSVTFDGLSFGSVGRGPFTINSNGDKVLFSTGNLQYDIDNSQYLFASDDFIYIGRNNQTNLTSMTGVIDLFGWGTGNNPILNSTTESDYPITFVEWGARGIQNAAGTWKTLTRREWSYLLNDRSTSTNENENWRFTKANIANVYGLILFPDDYVHPSDVLTPSGINLTDNVGWMSNNYTTGDWHKMSLAGAVFLPAAGCLSFDGGYNRVYLGGNFYGYYWSKEMSSTNPYCFSFGSSYCNTSDADQSRLRGHSVRLVQTY